MSANAEIVARLNDALSQGEIPWDLIDPDVVVADRDLPDAGEYQGHTGFAKWLEDWNAAWEDWSAEVEEYIDAESAVVSVFTMVARGKGSGAETKRRNATVNTITNGLLSRLEYYSTKEAALEAAGVATGAKS